MPFVSTIPYIDLGDASLDISSMRDIFDSRSEKDAIGVTLCLPLNYQLMDLTTSSGNVTLENNCTSSGWDDGVVRLLIEDTTLNGVIYPTGTAIVAGCKLMASCIDADGVQCKSCIIPMRVDNRIVGFGFIGNIPRAGIDLYFSPGDSSARFGRCDAVQRPNQIVPGVATGTILETERGLVAIEELVVGDLVLTRDHGLQHVRWIGSRKLCITALTSQPNLRPVRFRAGALGKNIPARDLLVSPQHRILIRSRQALRMFGKEEFLAPAKQLLQVEGIDIATDLTEIEYFQILFDRHEIVFSNGAETESLYVSPDVLNAVGHIAQEEIFALFPKMREMEMPMPSARMLASGTQARKLVVRHRQKRASLVS